MSKASRARSERAEASHRGRPDPRFIAVFSATLVLAREDNSLLPSCINSCIACCLWINYFSRATLIGSRAGDRGAVRRQPRSMLSCHRS